MPLLLLLIFPIIWMLRMFSKNKKKNNTERERILDKQRELLHGKAYARKIKEQKKG